MALTTSSGLADAELFDDESHVTAVPANGGLFRVPCWGLSEFWCQ